MTAPFKHKSTVHSSIIAEGMVIIRALAKPSVKQFETMLEPFLKYKTRYYFFFEYLYQNPFFTIGFMELLLTIEERNDPAIFMNEVRNMDKEDLYFRFFGENHPRTLIGTFIENPLKNKAGIAKLSEDLSENAYLIFKDFHDLAEQYEVLLKEILSDEYFISTCSEYRPTLDEECARIEALLKKQHPISFAQEKMGKSFRFIADWSVHEIIPGIFASPGSFRIMNSEKQILISAIIEQPQDLSSRLSDLSAKMKLLGDPTRMKILRMLYNNPMYGKQIADKLKLSSPTVSHHLEVLHKTGLLNMEQERQLKYFSTNLHAVNLLSEDFRQFIQS